ncbi:hypothetical protein [Methylorubrum thiocyanatum]|jgi:hypothetical protein|uniref:Uncharacterized protein n=1 Tax=Methylorubrum populi TaxID=223967 RepID=A0A514KNN9_9HYPH|nr:hypothetical protein F8B43_1978 [Methylorubrum populi]PZP68467.1 MAG: hypothetical protein DI590_17140 [Methylorubrum populi]QDI80661.1 hypothetical protein E8E01_09570 [Methylorubrum populi]
MAVTAIRKGSRIRSLWPSWNPNIPPSPDREPVEASPIEASSRLAPHCLTANELIAMARAARARRPKA